MQNHIRKRETFYLPGYDPRGSRYYYNMYKKEGLKQSRINGMTMEIAPRTRSGRHTDAWEIRSCSQREGKALCTETTYTFLSWDDLIRGTWRKSFVSFTIDLFRCIRIYLLSGIIVRIGKLSPPALKAALSPVLYILLTLLLIGLLLGASSALLPPYTTLPGALAVGMLLSYGVARLSMQIGGKIAVFWLLRSYVFYGTHVSRDNTVYMERLDDYAEQIAERIKTAEARGVDEVLIVGHSCGTVLTVPLLARILERVGEDAGALRRVSVLTLGQCIPMVSFLEEAEIYRREMRRVGESGLFWIDYTSPIDQVCLALVDFYAESGVEVSESHKPHYLSPRFHKLYHPENYSRIKKDIMTAHFMYLMASDVAGVYDYFKITAGHDPLHRYATKGAA